MAKHYITHNCGHTETHQLTGPLRDRDRQEQRLAEEPCTDCRNAQWREERERENAVAMAAAEAEGLPALEGTEKQVGWAESIRRSALDHLDSLRTEWEQGVEAMVQQGRLEPAALDAVREAVAGFRSELLRQTRASWWIDQRSPLGERHRLMLLVGPRVQQAVAPHQMA